MVAISLLFPVACTSGDDFEAVEATSTSGDLVVDVETDPEIAIGRGTPSADTRFEIKAEDISAGVGAPDWCSALLTADVRSLPSAMMAIGEASYEDELVALFGGAAATLRSDPIADSPVQLSAETLAAALSQFDVVDPSLEAVEILGAALDDFGRETELCDFSN